MRMIWDLPLSWILLPIKVAAIWLLWIIQQIRNFWHDKHPAFWGKVITPVCGVDDGVVRQYSQTQVYDGHGFNIYALRVHLGQRANGLNHDTDHMCSRQGVWVSILARLNKLGNAATAATTLARCVKDGELTRGYRVRDSFPVEYNEKPVSGDMLVGFCLGYIHQKFLMADAMVDVGRNLLWHKGLTTKGKVSKAANFKPGANISVAPIGLGAQELTYLCGLKCAMDAVKKTQFDDTFYNALKSEYLKRFWLYGGFLLCMFPTAGIWLKRGYNNDNVSIQAAFILRRLSDNWFERMVLGCSILWIWSLSWPWLNAFFTGLSREATGFPGRKYCNRAARYALTFKDVIASMHKDTRRKAHVWPIAAEYMSVDEFLCDEDHLEKQYGRSQYWSTLGQLANFVYIRDHV